MKTILKFKLNPKYRDPISIEAKESIFKGRKSDVNRLRCLINWRKSATVLVGGTRGVGKTSFVREALRLVKTEDKKTFPVVELTFANLDEGVNDLRRYVLKALIRGLHLNDITRKVGGELETLLSGLYDKSNYLELKETGLLEISKQEGISREEKETKERILRLDFSPTFETVIRTAVSGGIFYLLLEFLRPLLSVLTKVELLSFLFFGIIIIFLLMTKLEFKKISTTSSGLEEKLKEKIGKSGIAKNDLSADTLESGLRQVLQQLSESGNKAIFVIDELDKLDNKSPHDDKELTTHPIYKIIKCLKNLFSLSDAIFIFITSVDFFDQLESQKLAEPYSAFHTLFTDKIFLPPLYYKDVENIIDELVSGVVNKQYKENYDKFKKFISWKAKSHIFDTHNLIENYTIHENDGTMKVRVYSGDGLRKGNIEERWEEAAALQTYIAAAYDEQSYPPSESRKNEKLYLALREACNVLYQDSRIEVVDNKFLETIQKEDRERLEIDKLDQNTQEDFSGAIENLLLKTEWFNFTGSTEENRQVGDQPEAKKVMIYSIREDYIYPNLSHISKKMVKATYEKDFLNQLDILSKLKENLAAAGLKTFEPFNKEYETFLKLVEEVEQERPRKTRKSEILNNIDRINQIKTAIKTSALRDLVQGVVSDLQLNAHTASTSPSGLPMWDVDSSFSSFYQYVNNNLRENENYIILSKNDNHVLVGYNLTQPVQDEYTKTPLITRRAAKTKAINIIYGETTNRPHQWKIFKLDEGLRNLNALKREIERHFESDK